MGRTELSQIKNFGPYMVKIFHQIGIDTKEELVDLSYREIKERFLKACIKPNILIFYSIEMGLQGRSWMDITPGEKAEIKELLNAKF